MLDVGEAAQVRADFGEDLHHGCQAQSVDSREVHARPIGQRLAGVEFLALLAVRARGFAQIDVALSKSPQLDLQLRVAFAQMPRDVVIRCQRLAQHEQMLAAPVAGQRLGDLFCGRLHAAIAVLG